MCLLARWKLPVRCARCGVSTSRTEVLQAFAKQEDVVQLHPENCPKHQNTIPKAGVCFYQTEIDDAAALSGTALQAVASDGAGFAINVSSANDRFKVLIFASDGSLLSQEVCDTTGNRKSLRIVMCPFR